MSEEQKRAGHSAWGLASLLLAILEVSVLCLAVALRRYANMTIALLLPLAYALASIAGVILGVVGILQRRNNKLLGVLGILAHILLLALAVVLLSWWLLAALSMH